MNSRYIKGVALLATALALISVGVLFATNARAPRSLSASAQQPEPLKDPRRDQLRTWWHSLENNRIAWDADFQIPKAFRPLSPNQIGLCPDVDATPLPSDGGEFAIPPADIVWKVDMRKAKLAFAPLLKLSRPATNARVRYAKGAITIASEKPGRVFNLATAMRSVQRAMVNGETTVRLGLEPRLPKVTAADLKSALTGVVASYTTRFPASQANRNHNIYQAAKAIDGLVLMPGEVFSYNDTVGPRNGRAGYRIAPVLVMGRKVPGIGGGICQVSSTIYNAALLADMQVVSRTHHAIPVGYIPAGRDATVNYGSIDLRLRNNTAGPQAFSVTAGRNTITARVLGEPTPAKKVKISVTGMRYLGAAVKQVRDSRLPAGKRRVIEPGSGGRRCTTWRLVYENGRLVRRERLSSDHYRSQTRLIAVGTGSAPTKPASRPPSPQSAPTVSPGATAVPASNEPATDL